MSHIGRLYNSNQLSLVQSNLCLSSFALPLHRIFTSFCRLDRFLSSRQFHVTPGVADKTAKIYIVGRLKKVRNVKSGKRPSMSLQDEVYIVGYLLLISWSISGNDASHLLRRHLNLKVSGKITRGLNGCFCCALVDMEHPERLRELIIPHVLYTKTKRESVLCVSVHYPYLHSPVMSSSSFPLTSRAVSPCC